MNNLRPDLIITVIWAIGAMIVLVLMGMEIIHNQQVVDRLLLTIPSVSALIIAYWFGKNRYNGK
jgi:hypothetical protein